MKKNAVLLAVFSLVVTASSAIPATFAQQQVSGTITVQVDAADEPGGSGLGLVELYVDGNLVSETTTSGSLQFSWNTTTVPDGSHTLFAEATDNAGNQGQDSLDVVVSNPDTVPPTISIQIAPVSE